MRIRNVGWLTCALALFVSTPALAIDWGVGLEGVGTLSLSKNLSSANQLATSGGAGIILEERLSLALIELTLWEDAQLPYAVNVGAAASSAVSAQFIPIDAGLRLGFALGIVHPFLGVLGNYNVFNSDSDTGGQSFWGLGGDLGVDIAVIFLRFGLEARAFWSVSNVNVAPTEDGYTASGGALMLQGLLSARFSF